jgi:hypothetical protein
MCVSMFASVFGLVVGDASVGHVARGLVHRNGERVARRLGVEGGVGWDGTTLGRGERS